jgi:hypothetical protein
MRTYTNGLLDQTIRLKTHVRGSETICEGKVYSRALNQEEIKDL